MLVARAAGRDRVLFRPVEERPPAPVVALVPREVAIMVSDTVGPDGSSIEVPDVPEELVTELDREAARPVTERFPDLTRGDAPRVRRRG